MTRNEAQQLAAAFERSGAWNVYVSGSDAHAVLTVVDGFSLDARRIVDVAEAVALLQARADEVEREAADRVRALAEQAKPLAKQGRPAIDEKHNNCNVFSVDIPSVEGNDPEYLTSRIARDRPDILERMKAGEWIQAALL